MDEISMTTQTIPMAQIRFGGLSADEIAGLCDALARTAGRGSLDYFEIAAIALAAADCIRFMLKRVP